MADIYKKLSEERKLLQEQGEIPMWYTTSGWQLFKEKYQYEGQTVKQAYYRIARQAASHLVQYGLDSEEWSEKFFQLFWKGWLSPSTPVLSNMGTHKGLPVSCFTAGTLVNTSIGQKPIEALNIGDLVLTHKGTYEPITAVMDRDSDDIYELEFKGEVFHVTGNHLILTKEHDWVRVDELDPLIHEIVQIIKNPLV